MDRRGAPLTFHGAQQVTRTRSMPDDSDNPLLVSSDYALVPGPLVLREPVLSFELRDDFELYPPVEFCHAVTSLPGVSAIGDPEDDWYSWTARWSEGDRSIEMEMAGPLEPDNAHLREAWGGTALILNCRLSDLLTLWKAIRTRLPACWLHDADCNMFSPERFEAIQRGNSDT